MDPLAPLMQYGPNDGGYATAIQIGIIVIALLAASWIFGAAYALIANFLKAKK